MRGGFLFSLVLMSSPGIHIKIHRIVSFKLRFFNIYQLYLNWRRKWQPAPVFLPGESTDRGAWQATVHEITRVGHDLATKLLLLLYLNKAKFKR